MLGLGAYSSVLLIWSHVLKMIIFEGSRHVFGIRGDIDLELDRILIEVAFRNSDGDNIVDNKVVLLDEVRTCLLNLGVVPQGCQALEPVVEGLCLGDLSCPVIDQVKVVHEEVAGLLV